MLASFGVSSSEASTSSSSRRDQRSSTNDDQYLTTTNESSRPEASWRQMRMGCSTKRRSIILELEISIGSCGGIGAMAIKWRLHSTEKLASRFERWVEMVDILTRWGRRRISRSRNMCRRGTPSIRRDGENCMVSMLDHSTLRRVPLTAGGDRTVRLSGRDASGRMRPKCPAIRHGSRTGLYFVHRLGVAVQ